MEIGEEILVAVGSAPEERSLEERPREYVLTLVDVFGSPLREVTVEFSSGERRQTDSQGRIPGPFPAAAKVTLSDGRRILFAPFAFHRPRTHDPGFIGLAHGAGAFAQKNDSFDEADEPTDERWSG